ncbi:class I SAM-dependent methyltransferase [Herbiconiux sp. L3-i23]|uniref:class I SAM-dependent methyltransferase n=1 Tax=Herbiconiux sp. L3-i23 TaxID=2905871 RepID=UPI002053ADE2|nr:class I SAM-dependent methyltransferase [Herbiconiux sp. L3-i23]BDI22942.1 hypothetical protein L3i23_17180 [Herbiconiux sp. L3-i23]
MAGGDDDPWSSIAAAWSGLWGRLADPVRSVLIDAAGVGTGSQVLDVGCGSGEFVALLDSVGARAVGVDPSPAMLALAREAAPDAEFRLGSFEDLRWADGAFDVVVAVNALQFAEDADDAVVAMTRALRTGGRVAIAQWAHGPHSDIDALEAAIAEYDGEDPPDDEQAPSDGGLVALLEDAGLVTSGAGVTPIGFDVPDADTLLRMLLLGEDSKRREEVRATVLDAASTLRRPDGTYHLKTTMRWAVAAVD